MDFDSFLKSIWTLFFDPQKRIFIGYIFSAILIAFFWLIFCRKFSPRHAIQKIFDKNILLSTSSGADARVFLINRVFTFFISPFLITQLVIATVIFNALLRFDWNVTALGSLLSKPAVVAMFTFFVFLMDDFTKYIVHRWMHKWAFLWAFHKVHHSAEHLTPLTIFRTHPMEGILFSLRSAVSQGISISLFFYTFGSKVDLATVLGVNVFIFFFNVLGSNLRHSHIGIRYWRWLERILISPAQHQLHHSIAVEHHDKNFGATLALWDWLFGSLHESVETDNLVLGVTEETEQNPHSLTVLYLRPFSESARAVSYALTAMIKKTKDRLTRVLDGATYNIEK